MAAVKVTLPLPDALLEGVDRHVAAHPRGVTH